MAGRGLQTVALDHVVLRVRDIDRSIDFYGGILGLDIESLEEYRAGTRPFASARVGDQLIDLLPDPTFAASGGQGNGPFAHVCVRVAAHLEDEVLPQLRTHDVEVLEAEPVMRLGATGYGRSIYVRDPDGYVLELKEEAR